MDKFKLAQAYAADQGITIIVNDLGDPTPAQLQKLKETIPIHVGSIEDVKPPSFDRKRELHRQAMIQRSQGKLNRR